MRAEEGIVQLETELAGERAKNTMLQAELEAQRAEMTSAQAENAQLRQQREQILIRLREVEGVWRRIATIAANHRRVMALGARPTANENRVARRPEDSRAMWDER